LNVLHGDVGLPMRFTPEKLAQHGNNLLLMLGRLSRAASPVSAQQELRTLFAGLTQQYRQLRGETLRMASLVEESEAAVRAASAHCECPRDVKVDAGTVADDHNVVAGNPGAPRQGPRATNAAGIPRLIVATMRVG
jgi:hypothetical protein